MVIVATATRKYTTCPQPVTTRRQTTAGRVVNAARPASPPFGHGATSSAHSLTGSTQRRVPRVACPRVRARCPWWLAHQFGPGATGGLPTSAVGESDATPAMQGARSCKRRPPDLDRRMERCRRQHWWTSHQWHPGCPAVFPAWRKKRRAQGVIQPILMMAPCLPPRMLDNGSRRPRPAVHQDRGLDAGSGRVMRDGLRLAERVPSNTGSGTQGKLT